MPPEPLLPTVRPIDTVLISREILLESPVTIEAFSSVRGWFDISSCPHPFAKKGSPLHFCSYRLPQLPVVLHNHRTNLSYHFYICNVVRDRQNSNILQFSITDFQHVHEKDRYNKTRLESNSSSLSRTKIFIAEFMFRFPNCTVEPLLINSPDPRWEEKFLAAMSQRKSFP